MAFAITKTWTAEILTFADLNGAFSEIETELNAFPTDGALAALSVGTSQLQANAVTLAKMAASSVGTSQLVAASVTEAKLGTGSVTNTKLGATSITAAKVSTIFGTSTLNDSDTNTLAIGNTYQATSDGFLLVYFTSVISATTTLYSDSSSSPTTVMWIGTNQTYEACALTPIIKSNYWTMTGYAANTIIRWFPIGSTGGCVKQ